MYDINYWVFEMELRMERWCGGTLAEWHIWNEEKKV